MSGGEAVERGLEASRWLAVADEDMRVAQACIALDAPALGVAAYHCQQAAEKLLKGLLVMAGTAFRRTHDMDELADLAATRYPELSDRFDPFRRLTIWGTAFRYPGIEDFAEPTPSPDELWDVLRQLAELRGIVVSLIGK